MIFCKVAPTLVAMSMPRTVARQVVKLSGNLTTALASPFSLVTSSGTQAAVSRKSLRTFGSSLSGPPEYCSGKEQTVVTQFGSLS